MDPKARARAKETAAKQGWREPDALDDSQAARLRDALAHVGLYPAKKHSVVEVPSPNPALWLCASGF